MMTNELRLWGISSQLWCRKFWEMRRTSAITITGTWSTACSAALQVSAESWNAEPGKHFLTPVTSSCNVTDSALQSVTAWQWRSRHKMSLDAVQYFLRVMPPMFPESPQWLSLAPSQAHTRPIFGGIVPVPSFLYNHDICPMYHHAGHTAAI